MPRVVSDGRLVSAGRAAMYISGASKNSLRLYGAVGTVHAFSVCVVCIYSGSVNTPLCPFCRFSLLLLEFGEIYFEDYSCIYYPNASTESESIDRWVCVSSHHDTVGFLGVVVGYSTYI